RLLELDVVRRTRVAGAARADVLDERGERGELLVAGDFTRFAEDHGGAVVHGVVEGGAGQHEAVEERDRRAGVRAGAQRAEETRSGGAVEIERVAFAPM